MARKKKHILFPRERFIVKSTAFEHLYHQWKTKKKNGFVYMYIHMYFVIFL